MKLEVLIFGGVALYIYDLWYDGNYLKKIMSYKKHYKAIAAIIGAVSLYRLVCKNPKKSREMLMRTNNLVQSLPIDKSALGIMGPILDFTRESDEKGQGQGQGQYQHQYQDQCQQPHQKTTKRAVSETKKKFVASQQDWKCGACFTQLSHTFEIDHTIRLDRGGSNDASNLVALCRECHANKTASENM